MTVKELKNYLSSNFIDDKDNNMEIFVMTDNGKFQKAMIDVDFVEQCDDIFTNNDFENCNENIFFKRTYSDNKHNALIFM